MERLLRRRPKDTNNVNDMTSIMTAHYILTHDNQMTVDPDWPSPVGHLIDRSRVLLGRGRLFGARAHLTSVVQRVTRTSSASGKAEDHRV